MGESEITVSELKKMAKGGDLNALQELRDRGFFRKKRELKRDYELSDAQRRLWILVQMIDDPTAYNVPGSVMLDGGLNVRAFQEALETIIDRHESLRTTFKIIDGEPRQLIHEKINFRLEPIDASCEADGEKMARECAYNDAVTPFNITQGPLVRAKLIKLGPGRFVFVLNIHHIVCDAWSLNILLRELMSLYTAYIDGGINPLTPLRIQYKDYAAWQNAHFKSSECELHRSYWHDKLSGCIEALNLPSDYLRPPVKTFEGDSLFVTIHKDVLIGLKEIGRKSGASLFMALTALVKILLFRYTGQRDIIVGAPIAGRNHPDLENMIGFFVNTLALRDELDDTDSFIDVLNKVKKTCLDAFEHQTYPFDKLVNELDLERDLSRSALFDVMVALQNVEQVKFCLGNVEVKRFESGLGSAKFDLIFEFVEADDGLRFVTRFSTALFRKEKIMRMMEHFEGLAQSVLRNERESIANLDILSGEERQRIYYEINNSTKEFPQDKTVIDMFEDRVATCPDATAIVSCNRIFTYHEVNVRANKLARFLKRKGVGADKVVAVLDNRSPELVIALLGVLKAGGAYMPIDPDNPAERILAMLDGSGTDIVLTREGVVKDLPYTRLQNLETLEAGVTVTGVRPSIKDLDALPMPDRSLVDYEKYNKFIGQGCVKRNISLISSRGCPYGCLYCHKLWPNSHFCRSADNIFEEVKFYYDRGYRTFSFLEDIFNLNKNKSESFFRLVIKNKLDIRILFPQGLRGDILTPEYIDLMVEAGVIEMSLALESASPRIQKLIRKNLNIEKILENITYICEKYPHIILELFTMFGFPSETEEEVFMTLNFIKGIKWLHFPYLFALKIFPNTDMARTAMELGVSKEAIEHSANLPYHITGDTLPFSKVFVREYQANFMTEYFLLKERLDRVIPLQKKLLTRDEMVDKYNSYLPGGLKNYPEIEELIGCDGFYSVASDSNSIGMEPCLSDRQMHSMRDKIHSGDNGDPLRILFLDLSQHFSSEQAQLYNVVEAPLGLIYLLTYLNREFGEKIKGKILKSGIDFDNIEELKAELEVVRPQVIGIRSLSLYRDFFHRTVAFLKEWLPDVPIVTGGPYATSEYNFILSDKNIDAVVIGEGELTFSELIKEIINNKGKLPQTDVLNGLPGLAIPPNRIGDERVEKARFRDVVLLDNLHDVIECEEKENLKRDKQSENLAYVIYTSGSTGQPKGAGVYNKGFTNLVNWFISEFELKSNDSMLLFTSISFDLTQKNIFAPLIIGGELHILPCGLYDPEQICNTVYEKNITWLNCTPSSFYPLIDNADSFSKLKSLRYLFLGGEPISASMLVNWCASRHFHAKIVNTYGPTECTDISAFYVLDNMSGYLKNPIPIGKPVYNVKLFILDRNLKHLPFGVAGELCIAGVGVGAGYLNDDLLTNQKFTEIASDDVGNAVQIYMTGDLCRWLPDGNIEFLGRNDHQVKIRGFRIELEEIESMLIKHPAVKKCVVVVMDRKSDSDDKYLAAYWIANQGGEADNSELRSFLCDKLPDYMIPSYFVELSEYPLTSSGKIDKKALPDPTGEMVRDDEYMAPRNEIEKVLEQVWCDVLNLERVGVYDNFFELGGHSLNGAQLASKIYSVMEAKVGLRDVFMSPTVAGLAEIIRERKGDKFIEIEPLPVADHYHLSSCQRSLWLANQINQKSFAYNISASFLLEGDLNVVAFQKCFKTLVERHESLRTSFVLINGEPMQSVDKNVDFVISVLDITDKAEPEVSAREHAKNDAVTPFDLSKSPLLRAKLLKLDAGKHVFIFTLHHIVSDGWSMGILAKEIFHMYKAYSTGKDNPLNPLRVQYKEYAAWQNKILMGSRGSEIKEYWLNKLSGELNTLNLPIDFPRKTIRTFTAEALNIELGDKLSKGLIELSKESDMSLFMVLTGILKVLLYRYTGEKDILVCSGTAGRDHVDLENIIGFFINIIVLRDEIDGGDTFLTVLEKVKKTCLEAFDNNLYPFERLVEELGLSGSDGRNSMFDVGITLDEFEQDNGRLEGLNVSVFKKDVVVSKCDLSFVFIKRKGKIKLHLEYITSLFKPERIVRMTDDLKMIMDQVVERPEIKLSQIKFSKTKETPKEVKISTKFNF